MSKSKLLFGRRGTAAGLLMLLLFSGPLLAQRRSSRKVVTTTVVTTSSTMPSTTTSLRATAGTIPLGIPDSSPNMPQGPSWTSMFGAFLFVVALAALGALGVSYWMKGKVWPWAWKKGGLGARSHQPIEVLESIPLGQRRYLTVIDIGGEKHLLGLSPGSIQYLTRLSDAAAAAYASERKMEKDTFEEEPVSKRSVRGSSRESAEPPAEPKSPTIPGTFEEEYRKLKARLGGK